MEWQRFAPRLCPIGTDGGSAPHSRNQNDGRGRLGECGFVNHWPKLPCPRGRALIGVSCQNPGHPAQAPIVNLDFMAPFQACVASKILDNTTVFDENTVRTSVIGLRAGRVTIWPQCGAGP